MFVDSITISEEKQEKEYMPRKKIAENESAVVTDGAAAAPAKAPAKRNAPVAKTTTAPRASASAAMSSLPCAVIRLRAAAYAADAAVDKPLLVAEVRKDEAPETALVVRKVDDAPQLARLRRSPARKPATARASGAAMRSGAMPFGTYTIRSAGTPSPAQRASRKRVFTVTAAARRGSISSQ